MAAHEENDYTIILKGVGLGILWLLSKIAANYHDIVGNIFITVSLAFVCYKFYMEYKKNKKNGN